MKRIKFQTLAKLGTCMLLILLLVKVFIGEWVYIPSDSMFPTISARSLVWNSKITYGALIPQRIVETPDRKSTRLNSSHRLESRMPSSA